MGNKLIQGVNDLEIWCKKNGREYLLEEWDYEKNTILPTEIMWGSDKKVWWKCHNCGYEWQTRISTRTKQGSNCRICNRRINSSFPEQAVYYYIKQYFPDAINGDRTVLDGKELDIYIPSKKIAIEYDGKKWHQNIDKDINKNQLCTDNNITLIRIREKGLETIPCDNIKVYEYEYGDLQELSNIISQLLEKLNILTSINIVDDEYAIKESYYKHTLQKSLAIQFPELAKEWDYSRNGNISPNTVSSCTHDVYYWICSKCGNSYKASPHNRVVAKSGCPICGVSKRNLLQSFNVINVDTNEHFESKKEAAEKYNISAEAIGICCRQITKTAGGYHWKYDTNNLSQNQLLASAKRSKANEYKQRQILNIDTGEIFNSLKEAQSKTHIHNISAVCRGIRELAGGYHWKYADEQDK